jgi:hypothetical protein
MSSTKNDQLDPIMEIVDKSLQDDECEETCPLFMDGLPSDFSSNPQLAALASLINDDDDDEKTGISNGVVAVTGPKGGGKVDRKSQRRAQRHDAPYLKPTKKGPSASLGEAQLFLKMWSLK